MVVKFDGLEINVTIICNQFQYDYLSRAVLRQEIINYAENFFFEPFILDFELDEKVEIIDDCRGLKRAS